MVFKMLILVSPVKTTSVDLSSMVQVAGQTMKPNMLPAQKQTVKSGAEYLQSSRANVCQVSNRSPISCSESGKNLLLRYFKDLEYIASRVDFTKQKSDSFTWSCASYAAAADQFVKSSDPQLELTAVLYNIGVVCSSIGAHLLDDRSVESMRGGAKSLQLAAGFFRYCASYDVRSKNAGGNKVQGSSSLVTYGQLSDRFSTDSLKVLEALMLANAQLIFHELACSSVLASDSIAKVAAGVRDMFNLVVKKVGEMQRPADDIKSAAQLLASLFDAEAESRMAIFSKENFDVPSRLTHLANALHIVYHARSKLLPQLRSTVSATSGLALYDKSAFADAVAQKLAILDAELRKRHASAHEENSSVFHCTPAEHVPRVQPRISVKSMDPSDMIEGHAVDAKVLSAAALFVPLELSGAALAYSTKTSERSMASFQKLHQANAQLAEALSSLRTGEDALNLLQSQTGSGDTSRLSTGNEAVVNSVKAAKQGGGFARLEELSQQVQMMSQESDGILKEILANLAREAADDAAISKRLMSVQPGVVRNRMRSEQLTGPYRSSCATFNRELEAARQADRRVMSELAQNKKRLEALNSVKEEDLNFLLANEAAAPKNAELSALVNTINARCQEIESLRSQIESLAHSFTQVCSTDEPKESEIPLDSTQQSSYFQSRLNSKYSELEARSKPLLQKSDELVSKANSIQAEIESVSQEGRNEFEAKLQVVLNHSDSAVCWHTLHGYLQEGMNFYSKEHENLSKVSKEVSGFVVSRKTEADDLSARLASMGISNQSYPAYGSSEPSLMYSAYQQPYKPEGAASYIQNQYQAGPPSQQYGYASQPQPGFPPQNQFGFQSNQPQNPPHFQQYNPNSDPNAPSPGYHDPSRRQ